MCNAIGTGSPLRDSTLIPHGSLVKIQSRYDIKLQGRALQYTFNLSYGGIPFCTQLIQIFPDLKGMTDLDL